MASRLPPKGMAGIKTGGSLSSPLPPYQKIGGNPMPAVLVLVKGRRNEGLVTFARVVFTVALIIYFLVTMS